MTDPLTGAAYAAAGAAEEQPAAAEDFDPAQWNVSDTSPEAEATRRMYAAGLTLSALNGEPLADELAPPLDSSAEAVARRKLYAAGLSKSAQDGEEQALPYADWCAAVSDTHLGHGLADQCRNAGPDGFAHHIHRYAAAGVELSLIHILMRAAQPTGRGEAGTSPA